MKKLVISFFLIFGFAFLFVFTPKTFVMAADPSSSPVPTTNPSSSPWNACLLEDAAQITCLEVIFARILGIIPALALVALFVMLLIGGFKYMTSGGNPKTTASAKQTLTFAIMGIILLVLAYLIFALISVLTGINVLHFQIAVPTPTPKP